MTAPEIAAIRNETGTFAPVVSVDPPPSAVSNITTTLSGSASAESGPTPTTLWTTISGPGQVIFSTPSQTTTHVTFNQPGGYLLNFSATNANGQVSRTLAVNVAPNPAFFSDWQQLTWPGLNNPEITGPNKDPDKDGIPNMLEWALHLNATASDRFNPLLKLNAATIDYTYTRRKTAPGAATFQVQWSDTLGDDWSSANVGSEMTISETNTTYTVKVSVPMDDATRRFVRLSVTEP